jgi:ABC-2 type transport system permease protein
MSAFLYETKLLWKISIRNKELLMVYYLIPLLFYLFIGMIFTSVMPEFYENLMQAMIVFGVTMGGIMGSPVPLTESLSPETKKAYRSGNVPLWTLAAGNFISGFLHLLLMSLIIYFTAPLLHDAALPTNTLAFWSGLALMIGSHLSIGTAFGVFVKTVARIGIVGQIVFLPSIMLSGIMFPADFLPHALQMAGKLLPATQCYQIMCSASPDPFSFLLVAGEMILLLGLSAWKIGRISQV